MSTGLSRQERRTAAAAVGKPALLILNLNEAAAVAGLARRTLERLMYKGEGPAVVQISPRRVGVTDAAMRAWLAKLPVAASTMRKPEGA
jgi:predicted DNA-binding transcriptional regulator AlpA